MLDEINRRVSACQNLVDIRVVRRFSAPILVRCAFDDLPRQGLFARAAPSFANRCWPNSPAAEGPASERPFDIIVYHNPKFGTSRNIVGLIRNSSIKPDVVEYLKTPPMRKLVVQLIARTGIAMRELLSEKDRPMPLGLGDTALSDDALLDAMMAHPILIDLPLIVSPLSVRLCGPSEAVL